MIKVDKACILPLCLPSFFFLKLMSSPLAFLFFTLVQVLWEWWCVFLLKYIFRIIFIYQLNCHIWHSCNITQITIPTRHLNINILHTQECLSSAQHRFTYAGTHRAPRMCYNVKCVGLFCLCLCSFDRLQIHIKKKKRCTKIITNISQLLKWFLVMHCCFLIKTHHRSSFSVLIERTGQPFNVFFSNLENTMKYISSKAMC